MTACALPGFAAPIGLTGGSPYTQNFNGLGTANVTQTNLGAHAGSLDGWWFRESGTGANSTMTAGTGSGTAGDTYNFGLSANADRKLGGLLSGSVTPTFGAQFSNANAEAIAELHIAYRGETWRVGAASRADRINFQYSTDATGLADGTWTDFDGLDYANPGQSTGSGTTQHVASISNQITGLSIPANTAFWIRWTDFNASGSDDGMAVEDFSIVAVTAAPAAPSISNSPGELSFTTTVGNNPANQGFGVTNVGAGTLNFTITTNVAAPWLIVSSGSGSLGAGAGQQITVSVDVTGIGASVSNATLVVADAGADNSPQNVTVELTVNAGAVAPTVTTEPVSAIAPYTATGNGTVVSDGGASVTERGIVFNTSGTPTTSDTKVTSGSGTGSFTANLTGLSPGQNYFVRAYAINSAGTSYGGEETFSAACFTNVVTGLHASQTNGTDFTASWSALTGATGYRLDVSTNSAMDGAAGPLETIFRETMGSVGGTTAITSHESANGFDNDDYTMSDGGAANPADIRATSVSSGYTDPATNTASGAANVFFTATTQRGFSIGGIDVSGYADLHLSFGYRKEASIANTSFTVEWSTNSGAAWNSVTVSNLPAAGSSAGWYLVTNLLLSAGAQGTNLSLRWVKTDTVNSMRIDDVLLQGSPSEPPTYVAGYSNRAVAGLSAAVTGLSEGVTHYFRVRAEGAGGCVSANSSTGIVTTLTLTPQVSFALASDSASEGAGTASAAVELSFAADCTVQVAVAGSSTATAGADFTLAATQLVFTADGASSQNVTFNLTDDEVVEDSETAELYLSGAHGTIRVGQTNFTLTITDNEPTVQFTTASASVWETGVTYQVVVYKSAAVNSVAGQVQLAGSASLSTDYTVDTTNFTLNGGTTSATITVTVNDDLDVEGDETVLFTLVNLSGAGTGTPSTLTLSILDEDCDDGGILFQGFEQTFCDRWPIVTGALQIATTAGGTDTPPNQRIRTGLRSWQVSNGNRTLELARTSVAGYNSMTVSVRLASTSTSALNGADPADRVDIFVAVNDDDFPVTPDIRITGAALNNALWGFNATQVISTVAGTPVEVAAPETNNSLNAYALARITIPNGTTSMALRVNAVNNSAAEFWNVDDIIVNGNSGTLSIVNFSAGSAGTVSEDAAPVTVDLAIAPAGTGTVQIASIGTAGIGTDFTLSATQFVFTAGTSTQTLTVTLVDDGAGEPTKEVSLNLANPQGLFPGTTTNFSFTLLDDDTFLVRFAAATVPDAAEDDAPFGIDVQISALANATVHIASVGSALLGTDFTLSSTTVVFTAGGGTSETITVTLADDELAEGAESVSLNLAETFGCEIVAPTNLSFTLNDNEPSVTFAVASANAEESDGTFDIVINKTAPINSVAGELLLSGTAAEGGDFTLTTNFTLTGATTTTTITVTLVDDGFEEATEIATFALNNLAGAYTGAIAQLDLTIVDDDCETESIAFQGLEGSICDTWTITDGAAQISSANGATDTPANQRIRTGTKSWQVSSANRTLALDQVSIVGYNAVTVSVRVASTSVTSGNGSDAADFLDVFVATNGAPFPGTADVRITGNANARWGYTATLVAETTAGSPASFQAPQPGTSANNYGLARVRIPAGVTSIAVRVVAFNNDANEVWCVDDVIALGGTDVVQTVRFTTSDDSATEGDPPLSVDIELSSPADATVQVHSVGSAVLGSDFTLSATALVFTADGPSSQALGITVTDDTQGESVESISLNLANAQGVEITSFTNFTVTLTDNEPLVSFTNANVTLDEDAGVFPITVARASTNNTVTANITRSGTASLTADYTMSATSVTFSGSSVAETVNLTIVDDGDLESSETIIFTLAQVVNGRTGTPVQFTVTITDNESAPALTAGDIAIIGVNDSADSFSIVALTNLFVGQEIYFTDNGWDGSIFRGAGAGDGNGSEDLMRLTINGNIPPGTIIRTTDSSLLWTWRTSGTIPGTAQPFALLNTAAGGDQIYAFVGGASNPLFDPLTHLFVIDDTAGFEPATSAATGDIAPGLSSNANTALSFNFASATVYALDMNKAGAENFGTKDEWLAFIGDASNWITGTSTSAIPSGGLNFGAGCSAGIRPVLAPASEPTIVAGSLLTFAVSANDPTCVAPALSATGLPSGASFSAVYNGTSRVGTLSWTPNGSQLGTHPIRFTANDGTLSSSRVIRVYVADIGETLSGGVPVSQTNWAVPITDVRVPSSGNVTVVWEAVSGIPYEVYQSDHNFGGAMTWTRVVNETVANDTQQIAGVSATTSQRYFQVVLSGYRPNSNQVWGVIRPTVNAATFTLMSTPLDGDRSFAGALGSNLAAVLTGDNGGVGDNVGDEVFILEDNQSWRNLYLDGSGVWRESNNDVSAFELEPGQGFYVLRNTGSSAQPRFSGPVGNTGIETNTIVGEWNLIGLSQGRHIPIAQAFTNLASGTPTGSFDEEAADLVVMQNANGSWRRIMRFPNGSWFDLSTFATANVNLTPGQAVYYYRQPASGDLDVRF